MSDNQKYYYMRLKENFFDSDSMILLESLQDGYIYSNILLKLYLRSLKDEGRLMLNGRIPYNAQMLASITRTQVGTIEKAISIFKELGLIEILDSGAIYMLDIQDYIGKSSTEGDRKRAYRDRISKEAIKLDKCPDKCLDKCTDICTPEIEIELDIEKEIEKEIEIGYVLDEEGRKKPKKKPKKAKPPKKPYGEFENVFLTDDELEKLKVRFPDDWEDRIETLSDYMPSHGVSYNDHYATILNWARQDAKREAEKAKREAKLAKQKKEQAKQKPKAPGKQYETDEIDLSIFEE